MDRTTRLHYEHRALVMKALAHPTRLYITDRLGRGPACVCQLTALIGADTSTVSRHLSVLWHAGIVEPEKRGNQVFYSLRVPCVLNWTACVDGVLQDSARRRAEAAG